jgi:two-component system, NtrC family, response regulator PilR
MPSRPEPSTSDQTGGSRDAARVGRHRLRLRNPSGAQELHSTPLLGNTPPMQLLRKQIFKLARSQAPVYISGESGSGKELVARLIHEQGPRSEQAFVPVNCGAIPSELMESEFFGHKKGSFTGAVRRQAGPVPGRQRRHPVSRRGGRPAPAHAGQAAARHPGKSRAPVGSQQEVAVDVRILCATHKDLAAEVAAGDSARTSTTGSTSSNCACPHCASAARISAAGRRHAQAPV